MDDPQIGRFWQIDPLSEKYLYNSTYSFSENQVTSHVELEGLEKISVNEKQKDEKSPSTQSSAAFSGREPAPKKKDDGGWFSLTITLGASISGEVKVEGTPLSMGYELTSYQVDVVGIRDNKVVAFGNEVNGNKTGVNKQAAGVTVGGFGKSVEKETSISKTTKSQKSVVKEVVSTPFTSSETIVTSSGRGQKTEHYFQASVKASCIVGFDFSVKIPAANNNSTVTSATYGSPADNTKINVVMPIK